MAWRMRDRRRQRLNGKVRPGGSPKLADFFPKRPGRLENSEP
jgi:hypothetical protein